MKNDIPTNKINKLANGDKKITEALLFAYDIKETKKEEVIEIVMDKFKEVDPVYILDLLDELR